MIKQPTFSVYTYLHQSSNTVKNWEHKMHNNLSKLAQKINLYIGLEKCIMWIHHNS